MGLTAIKLQGTDGVRGRITREKSWTDQNPLDVFMNNQLMTPGFFEAYTFAYGSLLLSLNLAQKGDAIIVGWDPRDETGEFNTAAIHGIQKAGFTTFEVGVLPTPAIPIYMLQKQAVGSVMLTASHNPADQNGIKLFHGHTGLKFFPIDDELLTAKLIEQENIAVSTLPLIGKSEDHSKSAYQHFIDFSVDPLNSWVDNKDFSNTLLILDLSKGATATVAKKIFSHYQFKEVIYTNISGDINAACGVADIEGIESLDLSEIESEHSIFYQYETLKMFLQQSNNPDIQNGKLKLTGMVFDGDGDRCFRLDYDPLQKRILISSGDLLGVHLAKYIKEQSSSLDLQPCFINTVESDLNTSTSVKQMGFETLLTGVGDKWILQHAIFDHIRVQLNPENSAHKKMITLLDKSEHSGKITGFEISHLWGELQKEPHDLDSKKPTIFQLGIEESGHCITPGFIKVQGRSQGCFAGNGIKTALNALVAMHHCSSLSTKDCIQKIEFPFQSGIKSTSYIYYVDKKRILPGSTIRDEVTEWITLKFYRYFTPKYSFTFVDFPEEPSMIYLKIFQNQDFLGALFVRNSGTEDKSALYLRGSQQISDSIKKMGEALHLKLLVDLKNSDNEFAQYEKELLHKLYQKEDPSLLEQSYPNLPLSRILKEIELKEKLITRKEGEFVLTNQGKRFFESLPIDKG